jgi:exosortase
VSGSVFWIRRNRLVLGKPSLNGYIIIGVGLTVYLLSYIWKMEYITALSFPLVLFGTITVICGKANARAFLFPILFMFLMIPLPLVSTVSSSLQVVATHSSAWITGLVLSDVVTSGNQIYLPNASFTVGTACSGIHSVIALLTVSAVLVFLESGPAWKKSTIFLSAIPVAIITNILRIVSVLLIASWWNPEVAINYFHGISGILSYAFAIIIFITLAKLLQCRFRTWAEIKND